jgi:hypothetical protein
MRTNVNPHTTPLYLTDKQLFTLVQLGKEDTNVEYEDLMEIVELARESFHSFAIVGQSGGGGG